MLKIQCRHLTERNLHKMCASLFCCCCCCSNLTALNTWLVKSTPEYQNINLACIIALDKIYIIFRYFFLFLLLFWEGSGVFYTGRLLEAVRHIKIACACSF